MKPLCYSVCVLLLAGCSRPVSPVVQPVMPTVVQPVALPADMKLRSLSIVDETGAERIRLWCEENDAVVTLYDEAGQERARLVAGGEGLLHDSAALSFSSGDGYKTAAVYSGTARKSGLILYDQREVKWSKTITND